MNIPSRLLAAALVMALAFPALAQVTDADVDEARAAVNEAMAQSEELGRDVQKAWARQLSLDAEIADLEESIEFARAQIVESERRLEEVAVEMYMGSTNPATIQVLFTATDGEFTAGLEYLREVSGDEVDVVNQLRSFRAELNRQTERLSEASAEQEIVTAELQAMAEELQADLAAAQAIYDQLVAQQKAEAEAARIAAAEAARKAAEEAARNATSTTAATNPSSPSTTVPEPATTVPGPGTTTSPPTPSTTTPPPPPTSGGGACPVAGAVSFTDTWGDPRSGGRSHEGVDMIAARNTPLAAIYSGTIKRITTGSLSGLAVWLKADDGDEFFYAHLESYGDISVGQHVAEGDIIGYNGSSGNAPSWLPHLHFEWHPGGGSAVNPYPLVKSICG